MDGSWSSTDIEDDINAVRFDGIKNMVATAEGLGIQSALDLLESASDEEGISIEDVEEMLLPESDAFPTIYDEALAQLSTQRAVFGAMQSRMQRAMDFAEIYQENIAAAKSKHCRHGLCARGCSSCRSKYPYASIHGPIGTDKL